MRALYIPLKSINRALIPSFHTKNQGVVEGFGLAAGAWCKREPHDASPPARGKPSR